MHYTTKQVTFNFHESILIFLLFCFLSFERHFLSEKYTTFIQVNSVLMGLSVVILFVISLLIHEIGHLYVARRLNLSSLKGYIFPYGSVYLNNFNYDKKTILFALAGPFANLIFALIWYFIYEFGPYMQIAEHFLVLSDYMISINILMCSINLLPILPADGAIAVQTALTMWTGKNILAHKSVKTCGSIFLVLLIISGIHSIFKGMFIPGIWLILIGKLVYDGSLIADNKRHLRNIMRGEKVCDYMRKNPVIVPAHLTISEFVFEYIQRYQTEFFPVMVNSNLLGSISSLSLKNVPSRLWANFTVKDFTELLNENNSVTPDFDITDVLTIMCRHSRSRVLVVKHGILEGVISIKDLINYFPVKDI